MLERIKKYGFSECFVWVLGAVALSIQLYRYANNTLEGSSLDIVVFCASVLFLFAPLTLVNIIRKARGLETK